MTKKSECDILCNAMISQIKQIRNKKMGNFYKLDAELMQSGDISISALALLAIIESLAGYNSKDIKKRGTIKISNKKLAKKMALQERQVRNLKKELKENSLIDIVYDTDNTQTIVILHDTTEGKS